MRRSLAVVALAASIPASVHALCVSSRQPASIEEIVTRVENERLRYIFVGERHAIGPIKRFAVDLANALVDAGRDVGLYVEGFRTNCSPRDERCWSLAQSFNRQAFLNLLDESRAPVHAVDPPERDGRAGRMAATIAKGSEAVRVVLVGKSHVVHAEDLQAEVWVYGGRLRYPDPGDLAERFPRAEYLTIGLETAGQFTEPYTLRRDGCRADYLVKTAYTGEYWHRLALASTMADAAAPAAEADATAGLATTGALTR